MLTLYFKPGCPFCNRVLATIAQLRIEDEVEMKDITADEEALKELVELSTSKEAPYMIDKEKGIDFDESDSIVDHLKSEYGSAVATSTVRVHRNGMDSTCVSCEG